MSKPNEDMLEYSSDGESKTKGNKAKTTRRAGAQKAQSQTTTHASTFKDFHLKEELIRATGEAGFENPSEVQCEGIPFIIYGDDLICQAKSGMGKTAVFVLGVLQAIDLSGDPFQSLILCHTRELAYQIAKEFERLGKYLPDLRVAQIYGGVNEDAQILSLKNSPPQIIVGTPGRTLSLIQSKHIKVDKLKFFIIDECDKVLEKNDMRQTVQKIYVQTNHKKQVLMFTATLNEKITVTIKKFMRETPKMIIINEEKNLTLHGLQQFYLKVTEQMKNKILFSILQKVSFDQVIIFCSKVDRAKFLDKILQDMGFESLAIHSDLTQGERIEFYNKFKKGEKRIIVTTDLLARGIDIERVNLVINYDMPETSDTYLHRVGRAGRYKTRGNSVSFVVEANDQKVLQEIQERFVVQVEELPEQFDAKRLLLN